MSTTPGATDKPLDKILRPARICAHVGQTVVIYQRQDGIVYCNYKESNGCNMQTDFCRLRDAEEEVRGGQSAPGAPVSR